MQIVSKINQSVFSILAPLHQKESNTRLIRYCIEQPLGEGTLIYNLLTKEMLFLTEDEYVNLYDNTYLQAHWFVVPGDCNDKEYADLVKWVLQSKQPKNQNIIGYTIFTTTDCNARCFYCFELGRSRIPMNEETAHKVADYIAGHCGGEKVKLSWFGGEPLFNKQAIDIICKDLEEKGIEYKSSMISNGYLFDIETVKTAVEKWNLKRVQITLDGTENVYNKVKAYIYKHGSPYQTVMENIGHLLDAGVSVSIRLNMDMHNAENLLELVEDLAKRFREKKGLTVYAHHLFKGNEPMADSHTEEEWAERTQAMIRLEDKIRECGLESKAGLSKHIKLNHCMADSGRSVTILPDGHIGLCEHFSEDEFIGHIDQEGFDEKVVQSWKERMPEIPECAECVLYPECIQLKKCPNGGKCFPALREERIRKIKRQMLNEYERWKSQQNTEETDEDELC